MAEVQLPQLGETVTEGTITQWFKAVGDTVEIDEPLYEISTDKVDSEIPSPVSGVVTEILVPEGETIDVGTTVAVVSDAADADAPSAGAPATPAAPPDPPDSPPTSATASPPPSSAPASASPPPSSAPASASPPPSSAPAPASPPPSSAPAATAPAPAPASAPSPVPAGTAERLPLLSPIVRRLVNQHGLDPASLRGTGPGGRITRNDVLSVVEARSGDDGAASSAPESAPVALPPVASQPSTRPAVTTPAPRPVAASGDRDTVEPFNTMRRLTAEHMVMSKAVSPHVLMTAEIDYERVEEVRRRHGEAFRKDEGFGLNYLPFVCLAVVDAIREFPKVNASVGESALIVHHDINLGIAVDLHHEGLIVPVIHAADGKRLRAIAREISGLAASARSGGLSATDITGGTFTLSNPGPFGMLFTSAIINQPQVAILSTDGVKRRPVVVEAADGTEAIGIHSVGLLALSFDHRAFDGAYAAAFLRRVTEHIEGRDWEDELA